MISFRRTGIGKSNKTTELKTYIHKRLITLWRMSVQAFVTAAVEQIPIDTGMSRASFLPLAADVRMATLVAASIHGKGRFRNRPYVVHGYAAGTKSQEAGRELGQHAYHLEYGTPQVPHFLFSFDIVVLQHKLWELGLAYHNEGQTWQSLQTGRQAFITTFNNLFSRYVTNRELYGILLGV